MGIYDAVVFTCLGILMGVNIRLLFVQLRLNKETKMQIAFESLLLNTLVRLQYDELSPLERAQLFQQIVHAELPEDAPPEARQIQETLRRLIGPAIH